MLFREQSRRMNSLLADRRICSRRRLIRIFAGGAQARIEVKVPVARSSIAFSSLRIRVHSETRGLSRRFLCDLHGEDISADYRRIARKAGIESAFLYQLVESTVVAAMTELVVRLDLSNRVDGSHGGSLVSAPDHQLPGRDTDTNENADDRNNDHQLDQRKSALAAPWGVFISHQIFIPSELFKRRKYCPVPKSD
jgi:hypothetical protein